MSAHCPAPAASWPTCVLAHQLTVRQLPDYRNFDARPSLSKEDERAAALARRAQSGDYDDGARPSPPRAAAAC